MEFLCSFSTEHSRSLRKSQCFQRIAGYLRTNHEPQDDYQRQGLLARPGSPSWCSQEEFRVAKIIMSAECSLTAARSETGNKLKLPGCSWVWLIAGYREGVNVHAPRRSLESSECLGSNHSLGSGVDGPWNPCGRRHSISPVSHLE